MTSRLDALSKQLKPHQRAVVDWALARLTGNEKIYIPGAEPTLQRGVLLADGVGRGKTWEAMALCARLLERAAKRTKSGELRSNNRSREAHVLVLVPPGLVHKWANDELRGNAFREAMSAWESGKPRRLHAARTLEAVIPIRHRAHLTKARIARKWGKRRLEGGTYVVNVNLIASGKEGFPGVSAGRRLFDTQWDIVIVDEAHHARARRALKHVALERLVLLSATPFQLQVRELQDTLALLLDDRQAVTRARQLLKSAAMRDFLEAVRAANEEGKPTPEPSLRDGAEELLRPLVARNRPPRSRRRYFVLGSQARPTEVTDPWRWKDHEVVASRSTHAIDPHEDFCRVYLRERMKLLGKGERDFVPGRLRQLLSSFEQFARRKDNAIIETPHPKVEAVVRWYQERLKEDAAKLKHDGLPRKTIVFLRYVGDHDQGTRKLLVNRFEDVFRRTMGPRATRAEAKKARSTIESVRDAIAVPRDFDGRHARPLEAVREGLAKLSRQLEPGDPHVTILASERHREQLRSWTEAKVRDYVTSFPADDDTRDPLEEQALKRRAAELKRELAATFNLGLVEGFTGIDTDHHGAAARFRSPWFPWVLVASHVAEEGIDLQTYTRALVHYEVEWNPSRMEQREGRGDREGRNLEEDLDVIMPLVAKTYEERILSQLAVRMRWHSVLLGRPVVLAEEEGRLDVRPLHEHEQRSMELDLSPR